ncbi:putative UVR domain-containing protein [Helianthus anomalus]
MDDWAHDEDLCDLSYTETNLPDEARELEKELRQITKEKNEAVCAEDFEKAGELRDQEMDLKTQSSTLVDKNKEMSISITNEFYTHIYTCYN